MATTLISGCDDLLETWVNSDRAVRVRGSPGSDAVGGLRFAFYGRISTVEFQDEWSSRRWQCEGAADVVAGHVGSWPSSSTLAVLVAGRGRGDRGRRSCSRLWWVRIARSRRSWSGSTNVRSPEISSSG